MQRRYQKSSGEGTLFARLGVLFGLFFIMLIAVSVSIVLIGKFHLNPRTEGLLIAVIQNLLVFIVPALIYARVFSHDPFKTLDLSNGINLRQVIGILLLFVIGLPFLNQIIHWNESFSFPSSMAGIESVLREMENNALKSTEILLSTSSVGGLISGILIIGVLTGLGEELFFRGGIQKAMVDSGMNAHIAIWITAFIFSALHFQFYGFIPRILLGALFGYLLYWSRSIWVSVLAHAINNSLVVVTTWLAHRELISVDVEKFGIMESGFPWIAMLSMVLLLYFIKYGKGIFFKPCERGFRPLKGNI